MQNQLSHRKEVRAHEFGCTNCHFYMQFSDVKLFDYTDCLGLDEDAQGPYLVYTMLGPVRTITGVHKFTQPRFKERVSSQQVTVQLK